MRKFLLLVLALVAIAATLGLILLLAEPAPKSGPPMTSSEATVAVAAGASVSNKTSADVTVYMAFGSDSKVLPANWSFCTARSNLTCDFPLRAGATQALPLASQYLNVTMSFGAPVTCNTTKAELNLNNPNWYDITDVSLVDGYSNSIAITINDASGMRVLGPPNGATGNENVFGLFPLGCDICTARQNPPCGMQPGKDGCKAGSQYNPDVPCQYQGPTMGGASLVNVALLTSDAGPN